MATWQFDSHLVPASSVERWFGGVPATFSEDDLDREWFDGVDLRRALDQDLSALTRMGKSWHPNIQAWGDEDGDRFDVWLEGEHIVSVFVRIDVRYLSRWYLEQVIDLARRHDLLIVTEERQVLRPSVEDLLAAIRRSPSYAFVTDPKGFFEELAKRKRDS